MKIRNGGKSYANNTELSQAVGSTWRKQYAELRETGKLKFVENNIVSPQACERMLAQCDICQDTRLYDFFAAASGQPCIMPAAICHKFDLAYFSTPKPCSTSMKKVLYELKQEKC